MKKRENFYSKTINDRTMIDQKMFNLFYLQNESAYWTDWWRTEKRLNSLNGSKLRYKKILRPQSRNRLVLQTLPRQKSPLYAHSPFNICLRPLPPHGQPSRGLAPTPLVCDIPPQMCAIASSVLYRTPFRCDDRTVDMHIQMKRFLEGNSRENFFSFFYFAHAFQFNIQRVLCSIDAQAFFHFDSVFFGWMRVPIRFLWRLNLQVKFNQILCNFAKALMHLADSTTSAAELSRLTQTISDPIWITFISQENSFSSFQSGRFRIFSRIILELSKNLLVYFWMIAAGATITPDDGSCRWFAVCYFKLKRSKSRKRQKKKLQNLSLFDSFCFFASLQIFVRILRWTHSSKLVFFQMKFFLIFLLLLWLFSIWINPPSMM